MLESYFPCQAFVAFKICWWSPYFFWWWCWRFCWFWFWNLIVSDFFYYLYIFYIMILFWCSWWSSGFWYSVNCFCTSCGWFSFLFICCNCSKVSYFVCFNQLSNFSFDFKEVLCFFDFLVIVPTISWLMPSSLADASCCYR